MTDRLRDLLGPQRRDGLAPAGSAAPAPAPVDVAGPVQDRLPLHEEV